MPAAGIASVIRKRASSAVPPGKVALIAGERRVTFGELDEASDRIASGLKARGFKRGERLAVLGDNTPDWLEVFFAAAKLGGVVVPISHLLKPPEILFQIEDSGATWAFVEAKLLADKFLPIRERAGTELFAINGSAPDVAPGLDELRATAQVTIIAADGPALADLIVLQYTSGTTGSPKAAMHSHQALLTQALHQIVDSGLSEDDVYLVVPAFSWASGLHYMTLSSFYLGATVALHPLGGFDPDQLCAAIERHRVTRVVMVPTVLRRLVPSGAARRHDLSSLKTVLTGSEPVPVALLEEFAEQLPGVGILQGYGMSEFPISITMLKPEHAIAKVGSAGKATIATELRVVDEAGADRPPGEEGEIVLHSPATMSGYWQRPEETAAALVDGWLHTGDLGYLDEDGFLYIVGRKKDMIISGGLNVYPAEIEKVVAAHPSVRECAVVGTADENFGEVGLAHVVAEEGAPLDLDQLRAYAAEQLSTYKVPKHWVLREQPLPRNPAGKVQKHLLS
ncbi:MAG TPA: AMP-binding protein [Solirubrobacterales bacterium]|nr:AMP-binding protein [Solirubrobacterales bacterium]